MQQGMNIAANKVINNFAFPVNFITVSGDEVTLAVGTPVNFVQGESPKRVDGMFQLVNFAFFQSSQRLDIVMFDPTSKVVDPQTGRTTYSKLLTKQGSFGITG